MKLSIFLSALKLSIEHGYNLTTSSIDIEDIENTYLEIKEFLYDELEPIILDSSEYSGDSNNVVATLPLSEVTISGEFEYDRNSETYSHLAQDLDGRTYLLKW